MCCFKLNKCGLFSDKYNGMVSIKIGIASQYYSISRFMVMKRQILRPRRFLLFLPL